ncbi:craniofacial development protein 2-like [Scylla paramamosain]|uniref:craniofacial development protein 2-like n=1 Tax=Scylla paramamosain TaxID=85552 RepID=UPI00308334B2
MKLIINGKIWNIVSAYAPQQGCRDEEKEEFREKLEEYIESITRTELILIAGGMNAHVGESGNRYEGVHGGMGFGRRNVEGRRLLEIAEAAEITILNTWFKKIQSYLNKSGQNETQVDYILVRREDKRLVMDCKLIPGEPVMTQQRLLVADFRMKSGRKRRKEERKEIKVWELKNEKKNEFRNKVEETLMERHRTGSLPEIAEKLWEDMKDILVTKAKEIWVKTSGKPKEEKDTWWWNDEVQAAIKDKKLALKQMKDIENDTTKENYRQAKKQAKRAVARAKINTYRD